MNVEIWVEADRATVGFYEGENRLFAYDISSEDAARMAALLGKEYSVMVIDVPGHPVGISDHHFLEGVSFD